MKWPLELIAAKIVHWSLLAIVALFLLTGFGITEFRIVEAITFGILGKALAFQIHTLLWEPFVVLLALHIFFTLWLRVKEKGSQKSDG